MTLGRMISLITTVLFITLISSVFFMGIQNAQMAVNQQLQKNADNDARFLSTYFQAPIQAYNQATPNSRMQETAALDIKAKVAGVFLSNDRYQSLKVTINNGPSFEKEKIADRNNAIPSFFRTHVPLESPTNKPDNGIINDGGQRDVGAVTVTLSPEYVYEQLYIYLATQSTTLVLLGIAMLIVLRLLLRAITQPLKAMRKQAHDISQHRFTKQKKLPRTSDLREVTVAMNTLSDKIKLAINDLTKVSILLRTKMHQNQLTGLANYDYFKARLRDLIRSEKDFMTGTLFFGKVIGIKDLYEQQGTEAGNRLMVFISNEITKLISKTYGNYAAYISHAEWDIEFGTFAIVAPNLPLEEGKILAEKLLNLIKEKSNQEAQVGIVSFNDFENKIQSLEAVDSTLERLIRQGNDAVKKAIEQTDHLFIAEHSEHYSKDDLLEILSNAIKTQKVSLQQTPVQNKLEAPHKILHREVHAGLFDSEGHSVKLVAFKMIAREQEKERQIDEIIIEQWLNTLAKKKDADHYAFNLSLGSIEDSGFLTALEALLIQHASVASRISFELYEEDVRAQFDHTKALIHLLKKFGCQFGVNRVYREFDSIDYLEALPHVDYIKISGSVIYKISETLENKILVGSLIEFAQGLNIRVIAEQVDRIEDYEFLMSLEKMTERNIKIDGVVGYLTERGGNL